MMDDGEQQLDSVAIVGMSIRFPGADGIESYWTNLRQGIESIATFEVAELLAAGVEPELLADPSYVRARGVPAGVDLFDAGFFGLSPREAETMDPQHRIFLEHAWSALEHAGYRGDTYGGAIGVFAGSNISSYLIHNLVPDEELVRRVGPLQIRVRNDKDFLATLTSYKLNLKGPSVNVQTACSTSLVAVCLACQSLLSYQTDMALAGGVSVTVPLRSGYVYQEGVYAPDGHCRPFDAEAQGTVLGDGVGVVVLKRLADALADGDVVHAVIKGFATNNDGSLKLDYTAPSVDGQAEVIATAQVIGDIHPETVTYVEAHGTGTPLGDPIEVAALTQAFAAGTRRTGYCALGSVKGNIGHLDAAAGVASLVKAVLALRHREIPPSLHFERPNPQIDFGRTPFYVNAALAPWPAGAGPRRAGVSSFGVGGTNAHVVLEEAPAREASGPSRAWQLLPFSARSEEALDRLTESLAARFEADPDLSLADAAFTLKVGRKPFVYRRMLVCRERSEAVRALAGDDPRRLLSGAAPVDGQRPVAFLFSGLGDQYANMARGLYQEEPFFRQQVDDCCRLVEPWLGLDLRTVLYPPDSKGERSGGTIDFRRMLGRDGGTEEAAGPIDRTRFAHPALFIIEYALARLWMEWGVRPEAMLGYSLGEYVAACIAGVFPLADALYLVTERARLIEELPGGAMLTVPLPEAEVLPRLGADLSLAAVNGPALCVVAGPEAAIAAFAESLAGQDVACRRLRTSHAFHSRMLEPALDSFVSLLQGVELRPPAIPFVSNLTGSWITAAQATDPRYWAEHACRTVRFQEGLAELWSAPERALLEIGPGQGLTSIALQSAGAGDRGDRVAVASLPHAYDPAPDQAFLLSALGRLWLAGVAPDWRAFHGDERRRRVELPTYPFERRRFWIDPPPRGQARAGRRALPAAGRLDPADWLYAPLWKQAQPAASGAPEAPRMFLLLEDGEIGEPLRLALERQGHRVTAVRPEEAGDWEELLARLAETGSLPDAVVHLGGLIPVSERTQDLGFFSLLSLAQAWGNRAADRPLSLFVVTDGVCAVTGEERLQPEKATVLGPCRVIPQEYAQIRTVHIDLPAPRDGQAPGRWAERLLAELTASAEGSEGTVALRGAHRWVPAVEPLRPAPPAVTPPTRLRQQGVYLLTGGLGGVGLALAEHLARVARARLVLVGRSGLPPGGEEEKARRIARLEELGAEVLVLAADVSQRTEMEAVRQAVQERFGALHGIIHAAGVPPGGLMQVKSRETAAAVLAPKLAGTLVLEEVFGQVLGGGGLDFLVLCSSLSAITGTLGLVDHCAANAFLDAFAHDRRQRTGLPVLSVNWDTWLEVGQAARAGFAARLDEVFAAPPLDHPDHPGHPLLHRSLLSRADREIYATDLAAGDWILDEHRFLGQGMVPGTAYLEIARAAFVRQERGPAVVFDDVRFSHPLFVPDGESREVRTLLTRGAGAGFEFAIASRNGHEDGDWTEHARGRVETAGREPGPQRDLSDLVASWPARSFDLEEQAAEIRFGPRWRGLISDLRSNSDGDGDGTEGWARLRLPAEYRGDLDRFGLHPAVLDVATGIVRVLGQGAYVPLGYRRITVHGPLPESVQCHFRLTGETTGEVLVCDAEIRDEDGRELVTVEGYALRGIADPQAFSEAAAGHGAGRRRTVPREEIAPQAANAGEEGERPAPRHGILPAEGGAVLERLLARAFDLPQVLVSTRDAETAIAEARTLTGTRVTEHMENLRSIRAVHPRPDIRTAFKAPRNGLETDLAQLFREMLGIDRVGIHDNFFDLGGNSLVATQMISRLRGEHRIDLTLRSLFEAPTIAELVLEFVRIRAERVEEGPREEALTAAGAPAGGLMDRLTDRIAALPPERLEEVWHRFAQLDATGGDPATSAIVPVPRAGGEDEGFPLSFAQQRLWFVDQLALDGAAYNIATGIRLRGRLQVAAMEEALNGVVARHESLRTVFIQRGEQPVQKVIPRLRAPLSLADLTGVPAALRAAEAGVRVLDEAEAPFDLERGPLVRFSLLRLEPEEHFLLLTVHHIVSDKWSQDVLIEELATLYRDHVSGRPASLPPLPVQYVDFAQWQLGWLQGDVLARQLAYWRESLAGAPSGLELPTDWPRPEVQTYRGGRQTVRLTRETTDEVEAFSQREGVTLFMTLLTAFDLLLYHTARQEDVIVGTTVAGRSRPETERLIGFFVNNVVLRTDLSGDPTFRELLRRVRETALGAYANQDLPFERLVAELRTERDPARHPLFQIMFNVQDLPVEGVELAGLDASPLEPYAGRVKFDLTVFLLTLRQGLTGAFVYNRDLFDAATVARWVEDFEAILELALRQPDLRVSALLESVSEAGRQRRMALRGEVKKENFQKLGVIKRKALQDTGESQEVVP